MRCITAPRHPEVTGPEGERPPLIVFAHGGPIGQATSALAFGMFSLLAHVYWTSRGFATVDVNYRGSLGYGREYRRGLYGRWGEVDVSDCIDAAAYLAGRGDIDANRVAIRGGSAGGYTTLCALAFHDFFTCGASYFGISDLELFHEGTHKFESHYDNQLIGSWETERQRFRDRSPIHATDRITAPLLLVQGLEDRIVPRDQSETIRDAISARGGVVEYLPLEGERHGFRKADSNREALETELSFYERNLI